MKQGEKTNRKRSYKKAFEKFRDAIDNCLFALEEFREMKNEYGQVNNLVALGQVYFNLGDFVRANRYLRECLKLSLDIKDKMEINHSYRWLAKTDSALGNYREAFINYKMHILYRDSIINDENSRKNTQLQLQHEFSKKEDSLRQKQVLAETKLSGQKKQRYFYWVGLAMLSILSVFVFLIFRNQRN